MNTDWQLWFNSLGFSGWCNFVLEFVQQRFQMLLIIPCISCCDANCIHVWRQWISAYMCICMNREASFPLCFPLFIFSAYLTASYCPSVLTLGNHTKVEDHKQPFCIPIKAIWIEQIENFWLSEMQTILVAISVAYKAMGFYDPGALWDSDFNTLIHQHINQSTFMNMGAVCSCAINPLMVIGIETNQCMIIASMEIKTHGRYSARRTGYGVKRVRGRHRSPSE